MAARLPRRTFATPFVITLAAVPALAACHNEPPVHDQVVANPPRPTPTPDPAPRPLRPRPPNVNPPPPQPPVTGQNVWTVMRSHATSGSDCLAYFNTTCPAGATCNPPPPIPYACPPDLAKAPGETLRVYQEKDGEPCYLGPVTPIPPCPPNAICNPPRPLTVECPTR